MVDAALDAAGEAEYGAVYRTARRLFEGAVVVRDAKPSDEAEAAHAPRLKGYDACRGYGLKAIGDTLPVSPWRWSPCP